MEFGLVFLLYMVFIFFCLWLGARILLKAGFHPRLVLFILIPVVNVIMVWVFAFSHWPNLKEDVKQDL